MKRTVRWALGFLLICTVHAGSGKVAEAYKPLAGDIVFQSTPHDPLTDAIETATNSPYSHCGIVVQKGKKFAVLEAVGPVLETPLEAWIARGRKQAFAVYRLIPEFSASIPAILKAAESFKGRPYDIHYSWDDENIYCSELVYKAFKQVHGGELGTARRLGDLNWRPIEPFIRQLENGALPLDREMITPKDLSQATQLRLVETHGF